jgi:glycosyltransferase involved in cell wall biosynthesis
MAPSNTTPRVSVVVPTYRRPDFLLQTLASIFAGSYSDFEVLVANDGPADDVAAAQAQFPDERIRWLNRPARVGLRDNNIDGFRQARGEFIANLHDDDQWAPGFLSTLVPILESHPDVVVAFADHFIVDAHGAVDELSTETASQRWGRATLAEGVHDHFEKIAVVDQSIAIPCAAVFRRSAVNIADYPEEIGQCYDVWTAYLLARGGGSAWYVPERLAFYRQHAGSNTISGTASRARASVYFRQRILEDAALSSWKSVLKERLGADHRQLAAALVCDGALRESRLEARRAVAVDPSRRAFALAAAVHCAPGVTKRMLERRRGALVAAGGSS